MTLNLTISDQPLGIAATGPIPAPLLVLIHGAGMDHRVWAPLAADLAAAGLTVRAIDLPGHGANADPSLSSISAMAQWLWRQIDQQGGARPILVGHSMGSMVALAAAALRPGAVAGLVLVATADRMAVHPDLLAMAAESPADAARLMGGWSFPKGADPALISAAAAFIAEAPPGTLARDLAACTNYIDTLADAALIRTPTLLILGARDRMTPAAAGQALAASIADARTIILDGVGHMIMVEAPALMRDHLLEFVTDAG